MITLEQYLMGRDKQYPELWTDELKDNATILLGRVNQLLAHYADQAGRTPGVRSGWRPAPLNAQIPGAAPKSNHMVARAIDINDNDGNFKKWVFSNLPLCEEYELWLEAPEFTPTWCHLQSVSPHSGHRVFIP